MHLKRHLLTITAAGGLAVAGLAVAAPTHVFAGTGNASTRCEDGIGNDDVPILTSPITLGLQIGSPALAGQGLGGSGGTYVGLCYATGSYSNTGPEAAGGIAQAGVGPGNLAWASCAPDTNAYNPTTGGFAPTCSVSQNGTGGTAVTFAIPFGVCAGTCASSPLPNPTGVILGAIASTPCNTAGCTGSTYSLTQLCITIDGTPISTMGVGCNSTVALGGVTATGASPVDYSTSSPAPCPAGFCVPVSYVGLSGAQLATIYLPFALAPIPLNGVPYCAYWNNSGPAPAACTS